VSFSASAIETYCAVAAGAAAPPAVICQNDSKREY